MAIVRVTAESSFSVGAVNVFHFSVDDPIVTSEVQECVDQLDAFYEAIKALIPGSTITCGSRVVTVGPPPNQVVPVTAKTTTCTGANMAPFQVAAGITWRTNNIGKSYTGRTFIGPVTSSMLDSGGLAIGSSARTIIQDAADDLLLPTANGGQLVVWSPTLGVATDVTSAEARQPLRTQRRRLT